MNIYDRKFVSKSLPRQIINQIKLLSFFITSGAKQKLTVKSVSSF